ncbi:MAG: lipoprotein signal peptidase [Myxococcales bacterium]|nr:lipoprotein signal peptidase [Myxococcales bacterium]
MASKYRWFVAVFILALGSDQGSKIWARQSLRPIYPAVKSVIPGLFELRYSENPGSAFGLFRGVPGARYLLFAVGIAALFLVGNYLRKAAPGARRLGAELGLLAGGALGNVIDRIAYGRVTDFIVWRAGSHEWPTFNIADAALVVGVVGLLFDMRPDDGVKKQPAKKGK